MMSNSGLSVGKIRRLQQCATPGGHFVILAMDHRGNLRRALSPADPASVGYEAMVAFKRAVTAFLAPVASAVLLDPEYGAGQSVVSGSVPGQTGLVVAVEKTGYAGTPTDRVSAVLPGWSVEKIARMGASAVKLLLYYHPEAPTAPEQEALIHSVAEECQRYELPLFLEPLSFTLDPQVKILPSSAKREVVVETARRLTFPGVDVLKAEFPLNIADEPDEAIWAEACTELSAASAVPWVLLSAGVSFDEFECQTIVACQAGASGVMAGRAVWKEAAELQDRARDAFLRTTAQKRMQRLTAICAGHARPWTDFIPDLSDSVSEDWYKAY